MTFDARVELQRTTPASGSTAPKEPEEYTAFAGKDQSSYLEIRSAALPYHCPYYTFHLNTAFDGPYGTNLVIYFGVMTVLVRGRNLREVAFAIQKHKAIFIQEFDPERWPAPKNDRAPFIESIKIKFMGNGAGANDTMESQKFGSV